MSGSCLAQNKKMQSIAESWKTGSSVAITPLFILLKKQLMQKRLVKSTDKKLFGVCGGLGNYFDIDPTLIRIAFLVGFILFGSGLLLYIILAIAMPSQ
jgi:phage shock protein C